MTDTAHLIAANAQRWKRAKMTRDFGAVARRLVANKRRYVTVESRTGVPWFAIAVIHEREASANWNTQLGQGDPLNRVSVHVPNGRGPFATWEEGAYDALVDCHPYASAWKDWSAGGTLTLLERYNGLGYANRNLPSPYVWAGTDEYIRGKFVRDGVFDPNAVDQQLGCAGLIMAMRAIDASIRFADDPQPAPAPIPAPLPAPAPAPAPKPVVPAPRGLIPALLAAFAALVRLFTKGIR